MDNQVDNNCPLDGQSQELPSCLESLVSSCEQLRQLAGDIGQYHIKLLLAYGYAVEPKVEKASGSVKNPRDGSDSRRLDLNKQTIASLATDSNTLEAIDSTVKLLPYLNELCAFVEQCFATVELTFRRCVYHLNLATTANNSQHDGQFRLPLETTKLHSVFICLMDLIYSLVSLDQTIRCHTNLGNNLALFKNTCQVVLDSHQQQLNLVDENLASVPRDKLNKLVEHVSNLRTSLINEKQTLFQQCLERLQHLELVLSSNGNLNKGYNNLCAHFEEFITLCHMNLLLEQDSQAIINLSRQKKLERVSFCLIQSQVTPTLYMTNIPQKLFGLLTLFVLYSWLFEKTTKNSKTIKAIIVQTLQHFKSIRFIHLLGSNCYQTVNYFLSVHLSPQNQLEVKIYKQFHEQQENILRIETKLEYERLTLKAAPWLIEFQEKKFADIEGQDPKEQVKFCQQGINLANEINLQIKTILTAHLHLSQPIAENKLIPLLRLIALLKSIQITLSVESIVYRFILHSEQQVLGNWRKLMTSVRKRLVSQRYSERKMDTSSVLTVTTICLEAENLLTERGRQTMSLTLPMLVPLLETEEMSCLNLLLSSLSSLYSIQHQISTASNCDYLFWQWPTFSTYYNHSLEEDPCAFDEIHYFHAALGDITAMFKYQKERQKPLNEQQNLWLDEKVERFCNNLEEELVEQFKVDFLDKICQELEMELRLQTHRDLHLDGHNPFRRHLYNFKRIFSSPNSTFRMFNKYHLPLMPYVEQHLNRVCYNLTAISPNDWFTYDQMINLARHKYSLQLANSQLPNQTLDYGLDLLDITRNLALFVSRYAYDLTNQVFIEKSTNRLSATSSGSQTSRAASVSGQTNSFHFSASSNYAALNCQLNVVQVRHIANSIQTHGYGVVNSSVNSSYQLMKRLVAIFSKQMSDENLRAILTKEQINLSRRQSVNSTSISFDRANQMAKRFRSGAGTLSEPSLAAFDLDSLRQSLTHLGNLLAFIRLLKSGALKCASKSVAYLPNLDDLHLLRLTNLAKNEFCNSDNDTDKDIDECCRTLLEASENFDQCLADIEENFSSKTNYFGIILDLFGKLLRSPTSDQSGAASKREHLKLFYLLVPALTIHFVDYLNNCKERITSRNSQGRFGALISDDGFSMGLAFLLTALGQTDQFNQLEWFKQVQRKHREDRQVVEQRMATNYGEDSKLVVVQRDESLKQTGQMTLRRLAKLELEYESLHYTLSSALLFFRSSTLSRGSDVTAAWDGAGSNPSEASEWACKTGK